MPRDIDPGCAELEGVSLYDIDDLQAAAARNLSTRASEAPRAQEIVEEEIHRFARWLGQLEALPTVSALREHGNALVEQVLAENAGRWESASPGDLARVQEIARAVMSRLLHEPTIRLRSLSQERGHASLELVRELFGLRDEQTGSPRRIGSHPPARRGPRPPAPPQGLMRIGTRGSALALAQAGHVAGLLEADPPVEIITISTSGDSDGRASGSPPSDKSRWVDTIEQALLAGEIDLAVHSAKDVPGELAEGLAAAGRARASRRRGRAVRRGWLGRTCRARPGGHLERPPRRPAARRTGGPGDRHARWQRRHAPA